jgi:hypothetical protein
MNQPVEAYPLCWPDGWKRTHPSHRDWLRGRLESTGKVRDRVIDEVRLMGGTGLIISSNVPVRRDGLMYSNVKEPDDPGVAVYFTYQKKPMCFACDRYTNVSDNVRAIALTINAIRGLARWGASDMMERAFRGFTALPEKATAPWREVLGFDAFEDVTPDDLDAKFRDLVKIHHPDQGGDAEAFRRVVEARHQAKQELTQGA